MNQSWVKFRSVEFFKSFLRAFKRFADSFCRFGTVTQTRVKRRPIVNENNAAAILAFAALNPYASSRQMENIVELVNDLY